MENADHWNHVCVLSYRTSLYIQRYPTLLQFLSHRFSSWSSLALTAERSSQQQHYHGSFHAGSYCFQGCDAWEMSAIHDWCIGYLDQNESGLCSLGFFATKPSIMHLKAGLWWFWISSTSQPQDAKINQSPPQDITSLHAYGYKWFQSPTVGWDELDKLSV